MIPSSIMPSSEQTIADVPPPAGFRGVEPPVEWARFARPSEHGDERLSAAQKAGIRYEQKVVNRLKDAGLGSHSHFHRPILFRDAVGVSVCVPDVVSPWEGLVIEVKIRHMPEAWWQLRHLYEPVCRHLHKQKGWTLVEIVSEYDPATPFPEPVNVIHSFEEMLDASSERIAVWPLTP